MTLRYWTVGQQLGCRAPPHTGWRQVFLSLCTPVVLSPSFYEDWVMDNIVTDNLKILTIQRQFQRQFQDSFSVDRSAIQDTVFYSQDTVSLMTIFVMIKNGKCAVFIHVEECCLLLIQFPVKLTGDFNGSNFSTPLLTLHAIIKQWRCDAVCRFACFDNSPATQNLTGDANYSIFTTPILTRRMKTCEQTQHQFY